MRISLVHCTELLLYLSVILSACLVRDTWAVVIDDFSFDQEGISTDQFADYHTIEFDSPIGEYRELWGGGASVEGNCETTEMTVSISDGTMAVTNGPDCHGGGCVQWLGSEDADLSQYDALRLEVADIVGTITMRISIAKNLLGARRHDATLDHVGEYFFRLEDIDRISGQPFGLDEVKSLNICFGVEQGEFVALDSLSLVVPEPTTYTLAVIGLGLIAKRRRRSATFTSTKLK